jgi:hypothetical protein
MVSLDTRSARRKLAVEGSEIDNLLSRVCVVLKDDLRLVWRDDAIPQHAAIPWI